MASGRGFAQGQPVFRKYFKEKVDKAEKKINPGGEQVTDQVVSLEKRY